MPNDNMKVNEDFDNAMRNELVDYLPNGSTYFNCGARPCTDAHAAYYNFNVYQALSLIGKLYLPDKKKMSDYKKGVAYVSDKTGVTHKQVKVLRKNFKKGYFHRMYMFVTPYTCAAIIECIIRLLDDKKDNKDVAEFLSDKKNKLYRSVLMANQFDAIEDACNLVNADEQHVNNGGWMDRQQATFNALNEIVEKV